MQIMASKNGKNGFPEIEASINKISIINDQSLKPFVETFDISPVNIVQQPLGSIFGFFKIKDATDDSAYIANFLTSVLKKEYFINPKRSVEDSFDAALNKVNIALSEIAKNGNITWMDTFESAVCVIKNDMIYFAVTGTAKILLLRDQYMSDISEGLSSEEGFSHPIKTFVNVSSGTLKARDKIIVTSDEMFSIFSETEIKKNSERFPREKFIQFLRTALINELDSAETFIIDVLERKKEVAKKTEEKTITGNQNYFSAKSYEKNKKSEKVSQEKEGRQEYVDKKTGHIYVQGNKEFLPTESHYDEVLSDIAEKLGDFFSVILKIISAAFVRVKKWAVNSLIKKPASIEVSETTPVLEKIKSETEQNYLKKIRRSVSSTAHKALSKLSFIYPSFSKIKDIFVNISYRQKIVGIVIILVFVIIIPLIWSRKDQEKSIQVQPETEIVQISNREILASDKNIRFDLVINTLEDQKGTQSVEVVSSDIMLVGQDKIILLKDGAAKEEFAMPGGQKIKYSCAMEDLKLIFLFTSDDKLLSFSPVSKEFKENQINLPSVGNVRAMSAYLTYLYVAESETNNIRRYPRAEGGFGPGSVWFKDSLDMSAVSDMAIDENIYLTFPNKTAKLFKGEALEFNFENSTTPVAFARISTQPEFSRLYVLDSQNGRVIVFNKDGAIVSQYYDQRFEQAKDFTADEKNSKVIVVLSDGSVVQFSL